MSIFKSFKSGFISYFMIRISCSISDGHVWLYEYFDENDPSDMRDLNLALNIECMHFEFQQDDDKNC